MKRLIGILAALAILFTFAVVALAADDSSDVVYSYSNGSITGIYTGSGGWIETYVNNSPAGGSKLNFPASDNQTYRIDVYENGALVYSTDVTASEPDSPEETPIPSSTPVPETTDAPEATAEPEATDAPETTPAAETVSPSPVPTSVPEDVSDACGDNLSWNLSSDGVLTISGTGAMYDYSLDGDSAPWYDDRAAITEVIISKGVTTIGSCAFYGCTGLNKITFNGSAPDFGDSCFYGVAALCVYPADDNTWTQSVMQNYGGNITWSCVSAPVDGWQKQSGSWYYYTDGSKVIGWKQINGAWYYFNSSGVMQIGWVKVDNTWYYLKSSGAMATGWFQSGNTWYYLGSSGAMQTGWVKVGTAWYYLGKSGAMQTGWIQVDGSWYYMNSSGAMQTGWVKVGNTWYYLKSSGAMATGWFQSGNSWYYLGKSGAMQTGWIQVDGSWYYMNSSGVMQTGWVKVGNTWYYLKSSGAMAIGWFQSGGNWYYLQSNGAMACNTTLNIDGTDSKFDASGLWLGYVS